jgi:hypothetical protein
VPDLAGDARATLRAAAEVFVPGTPDDPTPGAADVGAERFIAHYLDFVLPGLADGVPALLDGTAAAMFDGRRFAALAVGERARVLDAVSEHEVAELREIPALLGLLTVAAVYGEWTGTNDDGALVRQPLGWALTGSDGPVRARPRLMR